MFFCIRLPNFVQIGAPTAEICWHIHFSRWRPRPLNTTSSFVFVDVAAFRRSKSISKPNFVEISQLAAEIYNIHVHVGLEVVFHCFDVYIVYFVCWAPGLTIHICREYPAINIQSKRWNTTSNPTCILYIFYVDNWSLPKYWNGPECDRQWWAL